jgi:23S rRNA (pseudouridine1915-N3)-methyltransferase
MKITLICVGKLKEKYLSQGVEEYVKRLSRYCSLEIIELADEKTPEDASKALEDMIKKKEFNSHLLEDIRNYYKKTN